MTIFDVDIDARTGGPLPRYVVAPDDTLAKRFDPGVTPDDEPLVTAVERLPR